MAIGKKTGGRTKGTPNAERKELNELMKERFPNWHPVIGMAEIANDETLEVDIRLSAMKEVSKYIAPQLKAIEVSNPDGTLQPSLHIIRETIGKPPTKD